MSLLKTRREKGEIAKRAISPFSHSVFYQFEEHSAIFIKFKIVVCKLFQFGRLKFVVWERVNYGYHNAVFILKRGDCAIHANITMCLDFAVSHVCQGMHVKIHKEKNKNNILEIHP